VFKEKYEEPLKEVEPSRPDWKDDCLNEIKLVDVPTCVFSRKLTPAVLAFWSSTVRVTLKYLHGVRNQHEKGTILHNGLTIEAFWSQLPENSDTVAAEDARLIVVGRDTLSTLRGREEICAIIANLETDEGLSCRKGLVTIKESAWNKMSGKRWEKVFLI
jgi:hypothetical protein